MSDLEEHRLSNPPWPARCTCGWEPALGKSVWREFDKHLIEVRNGLALPTCTCANDGSAARCPHHTQADFESAESARSPRMFTADEVIDIANETSDSLGNLYRLDFIDRIRHEAGQS